MNDSMLLHRVRERSEDALELIVRKYTAYVCSIIRKTAGEQMSHEDIEELASDVFLALWENAENVTKLKPYIGAVARNKAKNRLRTIKRDLPLDDETIIKTDSTPEDDFIEEYERRSTKSAILAMDDPDREIFIRHYYRSQTVSKIASETGMSESAIKHRLVRGRAKLQTNICMEGSEQ